MTGISSPARFLAVFLILWSLHVSSATYDGIIETRLVRWQGNSQEDSYSLNTSISVRYDAQWEDDGVTVEIKSIGPVAVEGEMRKDDETLVAQIALFREILANHGTVRFFAQDGGIQVTGLDGKLPTLEEEDWQQLEAKVDTVEDPQIRGLTKTLMAILTKLPIVRLNPTAKLEIGAEVSIPFRTMLEGSSQARMNRLVCNRLDELTADFFYGDMRQIGKRCLVVSNGECLFDLTDSEMLAASEELVRKTTMRGGGIAEVVHEKAFVRRAVTVHGLRF